MAIRKLGSATGEVTEVDGDDQIRRQASAGVPWGKDDEERLTRENAAADETAPGDDNPEAL